MKSRGVLVFCIFLPCCFAPGDPDPVGNGGVCSSNAECATGELCVQEVCRVPCTTRDQCGSNEVCRDSFCEVGQAVPCSDTEPCADGFTCIRDECEPVQEPGASCANDDQCRSGECSSGICCNRSCSGTCESCLAAETGQDDGICAPTGAGSDPGDRCGANATCDAMAMCALDDGAACTLDDECGSGFCVEGVCCDSACDQGCESCLGSVSGGEDGECTFLAAGTERVSADPVFEDCPGEQTCDGVGGCFSKPQGTACDANGECASGFCTDGVCCELACSGTCQECGTGACLPVTSGIDPGTCATGCFADGTCDGKDLLEFCASPNECASGVCAGGQCRLPDGESCGTDDNLCENTCIGGTCSPRASVTEPCETTPDCASSLTCSAGFCRFQDSATCASNTQCVDACIDMACSPLSSPGGQCDSGDNADCTSPSTCNDSTCLLPDGQSCSALGQCQSRCVNGSCGFATAGETCGSDVDCAEGLDCEVRSGPDVCVVPVDAACTTATQCGTLNGQQIPCVDSKCDASGLVCDGSGECPGARICDNELFEGDRRCRSTRDSVAIEFVLNVLRNRPPGTFDISCRGTNGSLVTESLDAESDQMVSTTVLCARGSVAAVVCTSTVERQVETDEVGPSELAEFGNSRRGLNVLVENSGEVRCTVRD